MMKKYLPLNQKFFFLLSIIIFSSCLTQEKPNTLKAFEPIQKDAETTKANRATEKWVDPMFYIEGQLCQHVRCMYQDSSGTLWFGTNVYGLMRCSGDSIEYLSEADGIGAGRISEIAEDKKGNIWFATYGGLTKFDGKNFQNFSKKAGLSNTEIWSLEIDRNGLIWIGTSEGVYQFDGKKFTFFETSKPTVRDTNTILFYDRITCITEDSKGDIWFGTDGFGISKYSPSNSEKEKSFVHFTKENGLSDNNISTILEDKKGCVWIGTMQGGLNKYNNSPTLNSGHKLFTNYTPKDGINGVEISGLYEDSTGSIWFASEGYGIYKYETRDKPKSSGFINYHLDQGLNSHGILSVLEDRDGRFWFGGWGGLFRKNGDTFYSVSKSASCR